MSKLTSITYGALVAIAAMFVLVGALAPFAGATTVVDNAANSSEQCYYADFNLVSTVTVDARPSTFPTLTPKYSHLEAIKVSTRAPVLCLTSAPKVGDVIEYSNGSSPITTWVIACLLYTSPSPRDS